MCGHVRCCGDGQSGRLPASRTSSMSPTFHVLGLWLPGGRKYGSIQTLAYLREMWSFKADSYLSGIIPLNSEQAATGLQLKRCHSSRTTACQQRDRQQSKSVRLSVPAECPHCLKSRSRAIVHTQWRTRRGRRSCRIRRAAIGSMPANCPDVPNVSHDPASSCPSWNGQYAALRMNGVCPLRPAEGSGA